MLRHAAAGVLLCRRARRQRGHLQTLHDVLIEMPVLNEHAVSEYLSPFCVSLVLVQMLGADA